ncbi:hypothetical protein AB4Z38_07065 [Arthrobacter sp. 2RAF6]|uniref:hypothetical protein n=1 Tax=Arthrobacter sp. 2RAF6 TaxID=3233002 RepID=UPI003F8EC141
MPEPITPPAPLDADPGAANGDDTPPDGAASDADGDADADPDGSDALGEPGKRALDTMKAKLAAERAKAKAALDELAALKAPKPGDEKTAEDWQREADARAMSKANERVLRADLKLAAKDLLIDPTDALLNLDLTQFEADADGEFDPEEIADALKDLVKRKPHLGKLSAQSGGPRVPKVPADPANLPKTPLTLDEQIAAANKAGDVMRVISLQNQKLANRE